MTSIEERVANALADIRLELFRGRKDPSIIDEIAAEYQLQPDILAHRLAKAYGSLEDLDAWQAKSATMRAIETRMRDAIYAYAETTNSGINIHDWLEDRAGRMPSHAEVQLADEIWQDRAKSKMISGQK